MMGFPQNGSCLTMRVLSKLRKCSSYKNSLKRSKKGKTAPGRKSPRYLDQKAALISQDPLSRPPNTPWERFCWAQTKILRSTNWAREVQWDKLLGSINWGTESSLWKRSPLLKISLIQGMSIHKRLKTIYFLTVLHSALQWYLNRMRGGMKQMGKRVNNKNKKIQKQAMILHQGNLQKNQKNQTPNISKWIKKANSKILELE